MMLSNEYFPMGPSVSYTQVVYNGLANAAMESSNFKVRIAAIQAFSAPCKLQKYQSMDRDAISNINMLANSCCKSIESIETALARSSNDDRKYLDLFFDAIHQCFVKFRDMQQYDAVGLDEFDVIERRVLELETITLQPRNIVVQND